jgi:D-serine deaminase-like pyridoxal phosphate-dependent protein
MARANDTWVQAKNIDEVPSPALLVYPDRIEENLHRMLRMAGDAARLRPHVKTHKMPELIRRQLRLGITKFKCATIAEADMTASCGAEDVLLAYQPVGPNATRMLRLVRQYPRTKFAAIADDEAVIRQLSDVFGDAGATLTLLLDLDCGMHRCGVEPGPRALELYRLIGSLPGVAPGGLHVYDGHLQDSDPIARAAASEKAFAPVVALRQQIEQNGLTVPRVVAGGTPTFPILARRSDVECSPGTCVLWDFGYGDKLRDMDFLVAALLLTRVISKPGNPRLCFDLGHKALAAENPHPRVRLLGLEDAQFITHSEEHLVVETPRADEFRTGDAVYGIPRHICPTVALYSEAVVVRDGRAVERWKITARERKLTV